MNTAEIAQMLRDSTRSGSEEDSPEGSRYITLSDTLTKDVIVYLERESCEGEAAQAVVDLLAPQLKNIWFTSGGQIPVKLRKPLVEALQRARVLEELDHG